MRRRYVVRFIKELNLYISSQTSHPLIYEPPKFVTLNVNPKNKLPDLLYVPTVIIMIVIKLKRNYI